MTNFHVETNYGQLKPNDRFTIRYQEKTLTWCEHLVARNRHGLCKVLPDMWAENQHGNKVSFTDNYPVWKWQT